MDTAVKQRLLGGIVLVAGAAVLLPLMLDGSGAKLLGRLEPLPAKPPVATVEQAQPELNQQQREAEDDIAAAHGEDTPFYSLSKPTVVEETSKTPEQIAEDLAAKKRTADLLNSNEEITPEQALKQKQEADKALAILEASSTQEQQAAEQQLAAQAALKTEQIQAEKLAKEKALKQEAEKARLALEGKTTITDVDNTQKIAQEKAKLEAKKQADAEKLAKEKTKAEKIAQEKLQQEKAQKKEAEERLAEEKAQQAVLLAKKEAQEKAKLEAKKQAEAEAKAEKLAAEKAAAKKKEEEQKARLALEGKTSEKNSKSSDKATGDAWVVQVASVSDKNKADALSAKLSAKGYRSRVVKSGESWKIVVGPELDKSKAQSLKGKINDDSGLGISGAWVAPWKP